MIRLPVNSFFAPSIQLAMKCRKYLHTRLLPGSVGDSLKAMSYFAAGAGTTDLA